jgi:AraC-like DNA-binding protein
LARLEVFSHRSVEAYVAEVFALHRGEFGRAALMKLRSGLLPHAHSDAHIVWWLGGARVEAHVGSYLWRSAEHELIGINPYESHDLRIVDNDQPVICLALYISQAWLMRRHEAAARPFQFRAPFIQVGPELRRASSDVMDLMLNKRVTFDQRERKLECLIDAAIGDADPQMQTRGAMGVDFRIRRAIAFMRENIGARLRVDEVARQVGLSRPHFFAMFRRQLSTPPHIYWNALRLEAAINRLTRCDVSLTSIALDLGFSAASNFSRFFRDHTGVTPREYRRAAHQGPQSI